LETPGLGTFWIRHASSWQTTVGIHAEVGGLKRLQRVLLVSFVAIVLYALHAPPASAAPPLKLDSGPVTDDARVIGADIGNVEQALDELRTEHGVQLFVVFVDSFDGMDSQDWTDETAVINGLGLNDILLAVAVEDRQYAWSVDQGFTLTDDALAEVATDDIEPNLQDEDWAGAVVAAADGYGRALTAASAPPATAQGDTETGGSSLLGCLLPIGLLAVGGGVVAFLLSKRRRKGAPAATAGGAPLDMKSLETKAGKLLVDVDDALRDSEQELGFAEAEFGAAAIEEYKKALEQSKSEVAEAFRIQQKVYDSEPEDEATRRQMLEKIVQLAEAADARLDEKAEGFARLRDISKRVDDVLGSVAKRLDDAEAKLPVASETLADLKKAYPAAALGEVADDDTEAAGLIALAREAIAAGTEASSKDDKNAAAMSARTAEEAVAQIEQLFGAVAGARKALEQARADLERELPALEQAAAEAEAKGSAELAPLVKSARSVAADAKAALAAATLDPVAQLARVREAATALESALGKAKEAADAAQAAVRSARDRITAAESYIQTRRVAVGAQARSSLAEAKGRLARAEQLLKSDPAAALAEAQAAEQYAESASRYAQGDVSTYERNAPTYAPPSRSGSAGQAAAAFGGAALGSVMRGTTSTGGSTSAARRSSPSPSSFGGSSRRSGSSTRSSGGRRGGGGRF
jgi:uncharacterized membrane protein YgcG